MNDITRRTATRFRSGRMAPREESLAVEEPLEIRIADRSLTVLMRTPGQDIDLVAGLLFSEGIVSSPDQIGTIAHCTDDTHPDRANIVNVRLAPGVEVDWERLKRSFFSNTSCGLCGKTTIEAVRASVPAVDDGALRIGAETLLRLPPALQAAQAVFAKTGGLHACGLFDGGGDALIVREDVGRHNAVDKVIGAAVLDGSMPLGGGLLMVSGRASFEIVQKALVARIPMICAVSAPSSLAVDLARESNLTLVGFLREGSFNVYSGEQRVAGLPAGAGASSAETPGVAGRGGRGIGD